MDENVEHKQEIIENLPQDLTKRLESNGATIIKGHATFKNNHTVVVDNVGEVTAEKIVIATGLRPHRLNIAGTELAHDSEDFHESQAIARSHYDCRFWLYWDGICHNGECCRAKVTVMLHSDKVLRNFHQPYVKMVVDDLKQRGVTFIENSRVQSFEKSWCQLSN